MEEAAIFTCLCGRSFLGTTRDFDIHLEMDCPVYREAGRKLEEIRREQQKRDLAGENE
jgi:hypothetical protein